MTSAAIVLLDVSWWLAFAVTALKVAEFFTSKRLKEAVASSIETLTLRLDYPRPIRRLSNLRGTGADRVWHWAAAGYVLLAASGIIPLQVLSVLHPLRETSDGPGVAVWIAIHLTTLGLFLVFFGRRLVIWAISGTDG